MVRAKKQLTDAELELMTILWKIGEGSVADVIEQIPSRNKPAYTTVSTILRILEQKGALTARKEGRGHVYVPRLSKDEYEETVIHHVVDKVFDRAPSALVRRLIETESMSADELDEIRALLSKKRS